MKSPKCLGEGRYLQPCAIPTLPSWAHPGAGLRDGMCQLGHRPGGCGDRARAAGASALPFLAHLLPGNASGMWQERLRLRTEPFPTLTMRLDMASPAPERVGAMLQAAARLCLAPVPPRSTLDKSHPCFLPQSLVCKMDTNTSQGCCET